MQIFPLHSLSSADGEKVENNAQVYIGFINQPVSWWSDRFSRQPEKRRKAFWPNFFLFLAKATRLHESEKGGKQKVFTANICKKQGKHTEALLGKWPGLKWPGMLNQSSYQA